MESLHRAIADFIGERSAPTVEIGDTVGRAVDIMRTEDAYCVYVQDGGKLAGVLTERDVVCRILAAGHDLGAPVAEYMTREPESLKANDDIAYAINKMAVGGYRNVPIVDDDGRLVSALSVREVVAHLAEVLSDPEVESDINSEWLDIGGGG
ncbi:MAG: CBS domain-containing protein [Deltaproteobacteria bacterium]|nr:CBS domain-containing protein [Deltaproteobacteria bacterium]